MLEANLRTRKTSERSEKPAKINSMNVPDSQPAYESAATHAHTHTRTHAHTYAHAHTAYWHPPHTRTHIPLGKARSPAPIVVAARDMTVSNVDACK